MNNSKTRDVAVNCNGLKKQEIEMGKKGWGRGDRARGNIVYSREYIIQELIKNYSLHDIRKLI